MMGKKIVIVMPDGVGLKNFGFSNVSKFLKNEGFELLYWNSTPFDLSKLGLKFMNLSNSIPAKADLLKKAKIDLELDEFSLHFNNKVFQTYKFPLKSNSFKAYLKKQITNYYKLIYKNRINAIQLKINQTIIASKEYKEALNQLKLEQPDILFSTNQRASNAIAPVLAAKSLNIQTACFIFSWDNLPKATKIIETDYYFVWSEFMRNELQAYYPHIEYDQIKVVGTPQFEYHYKLKEEQKKEFHKKYKLSDHTNYILFSGDDVTTSPKDEQYLESVCNAVMNINNNSEHNLEVIFRPCPVDFSNRYDKVLNEYDSILTKIQPYWEKQGVSWNTFLPTKADAILLANTINASNIVINLGSSMVFDAVCHNKPTAYINFDPSGIDTKDWSVNKIYNFVHFQSMPNKDAVIWINNKHEIADKILEGLSNPQPYVQNAQQWFETINQHPPEKASERIVETINEIIDAQ